MLIRLLTRIGDKVGSLGALVSAMGCAMCFPAIASLGAAVGLGFLNQWEGLFVNTLLPLFALVLNALGWISHRQWHRSLLGMVGPVLLLSSCCCRLCIPGFNTAGARMSPIRPWR